MAQPQPLPQDRGLATFSVSEGSMFLTAAQDRQYEALNVCRATALGALLSEKQATDGITGELRQLGFSNSLLTAETVEPINLVDAVHSFQYRHGRLGHSWLDRAVLWQTVNAGGQRRTAEERAQLIGELLLVIVGSELQLESTAAAAALWRLAGRYVRSIGGTGRRWIDRLFLTPDPPTPLADAGGGPPPRGPDDDQPWPEYFIEELVERAEGDDVVTLLELLWERLLMALQSPEQVARDLATVALAPHESGQPTTSSPPSQYEPPMTRTPGPSTIVHGTWGWYGPWWRPRDEFHQFVAEELRSNLYAGGTYFSWSGYYRQRHRERAAEDFCRWAQEVAPYGLGTVFAHSYGAEVVARAILAGAIIDELVLLSAPVTEIVNQAAQFMANRGRLVVDVRLPVDPVLLLDGTRQRFKSDAPVDTTVLKWRLGHGATHQPVVWKRDTSLQELQSRLGKQ